MRLTSVAIVLILVVTVAAGCAPRAAVPAGSSAAQSASKPAEERPIREQAMPFEARGALPVGFPVQVPVIAGSVVNTSSAAVQGSWVYEVETSGTAVAVADWYSRAYHAAEWVTVDEKTSVNAGRTAVDMNLQKNGALSQVHVEETPAGTVSVRGAVGMGGQVPQAY